MLVLIFCILMFAALYAINRRVLSSNYLLINPISMLIVVWVAVFIMHSAYFEYINHTPFTYLIILAGVFLFSSAFWIGVKRAPIKKGVHLQYNMSFLSKLLVAFIIVDIMRLIYYYNLMVNEIAGGGLLYFLANSNEFRFTYLNREFDFWTNVFTFLTNATAYLGYVILGIYVANKGKRWVLGLIVCTLMELSLSILTISKLAFSLYALVLFIAYLTNLKTLREQKRLLRKIAPVLLALLVGFFLIIGYQRNYTDTREAGLVGGVMDGIIDYFAGPMEAFGRLVANPKTKLGTMGMIDIGRTETNVYTWFYPFFRSFSYVGFVLGTMLMGFFMGKFYNTRKKTFFADMCNTWICSFIAFSFFDLLLSHTVFIFMFFYAYFVHSYFNRKLYVYQ